MERRRAAARLKKAERARSASTATEALTAGGRMANGAVGQDLPCQRLFDPQEHGGHYGEQGHDPEGFGR